MTDLLNKYKDASPSPRGQMTIEHFERLHLIEDKREAEKKKQIRIGKFIAFIEACCIMIGIYACIFTVHNIRVYNQSFDRCEALLEQINANTAILDQEINELRAQMGEVDYE